MEETEKVDVQDLEDCLYLKHECLGNGSNRFQIELVDAEIISGEWEAFRYAFVGRG